jgi:hypothetical protein
MAELLYDDLIADMNKQVEDKSLFFTAKDGTRVCLRPIMLLHDNELKVVQTLMKSLDKDDTDIEAQIATVDRMLIAVADKKKAFETSLKDFPPAIRTQIFEKWMEADDAQGEASDSES